MPVQVIDRSILFTPGWGLSPADRSAALAEFAKGVIADAKAEIETNFGAPPETTVAVDGTIDKPLTSVKPDGTIVATFDLVTDAIVWIGDQLVKHSPFLTGQYLSSHRIFADGVEVANVAGAAGAKEIVFSSIVPYARKIERGEARDAPDGVYQAVALLASQRFGNVAKIKFGYREIEAPGSPLAEWATGHSASIRHDRKRAAQRRKDVRQPAIIITTR